MSAYLPELGAAALLLLAALAEAVHAGRVRRGGRLFFGPRARPARWTMAAPLLRPVALAALGWGLGTLLLIAPKKHSPGEDERPAFRDHRHVVLILDVSPSMRLEDAGPDQEQSRMARARDVLESFLARIPLEYYRLSVVATYNGAKPVVIDTRDVDVVRNILGDLPMHYAFRAGKTKLFDGLEEAAKIAKDWPPRSTTLVLVSDGDTVPATGMPRMPASVDQALVVGVGDPVTGKFIDGRQSRQDVSTLRQIAARLGGVFHNANEKHLASALIGDLTRLDAQGRLLMLSRREYALLAIALGAAVLALLPYLLQRLGSRWRPGVPAPSAAARRRPLARVPAETATLTGHYEGRPR